MSAQPAKGARIPKTVQINVSPDGTCSPDPARVMKNDKIVWDGAATQMEFPNENPFDDQQGKKFKPKQAYVVGKSQGQFKYNVTTSSGTFDPDIIIDPPPP